MCREIPMVLVLIMHKQVLTIFAFQKDKPHKSLSPKTYNIGIQLVKRKMQCKQKLTEIGSEHEHSANDLNEFPLNQIFHYLWTWLKYKYKHKINRHVLESGYSTLTKKYQYAILKRAKSCEGTILFDTPKTGCHASCKDGIFSMSISLHISLTSTYEKEMEIELYVSWVSQKTFHELVLRCLVNESWLCCEAYSKAPI